VKKESILLVLNYHNFSSYSNYFFKRGQILDVSFAKRFERQVRFLRRHFNFVTPEDFINQKPSGISIHLTFDDGYRDNFDIAFPILKKYNVKATFFLATGFVNSSDWLWHDKARYLVSRAKLAEEEVESLLRKMNQGGEIPKTFIEMVNTLFDDFFGDQTPRLMVNWDEVKLMRREGFEIAPHTHSHLVLDSLPRAIQKAEILNSVLAIKNNLGYTPKSFAYPNGRYNKTTLSVLKEINILEYGFNTEFGHNYTIDNLLEFKRVGVNPSDPVGFVILKIVKSLITK